MTHATLRNFPASRNTEKSYSACKSIGSLLRAAASTVRPIRSLRGWPLRLVIAAIAALRLAAPGAVVGDGGGQRPPSRAGWARLAIASGDRGNSSVEARGARCGDGEWRMPASAIDGRVGPRCGHGAVGPD